MLREKHDNTTTNYRILALLSLGVLSLLLGGFVLIGVGCRPKSVPDASSVAQVEAQEAPPLATVATVATNTPRVTLTAPTAVYQPTLTPLPTDQLIQTAPVATATALVPAITAAVTRAAPLPTPQGIYSWTLKVPILMYHYVSEPPPDADKYRQDLSVTPEQFRQQMAFLAENGYTTIDFYDLSRAITSKQELPPKPVIISLDDGYLDNYTQAFPILQEFAFTATFFVVTEFIDKGYAGHITWDMAKEMAAAGMRIEPHSKTHADLSSREKDFLIYEILGSQETIAAHIGTTPRYFCYPSGRYDANTIEVLQELDFWGAVTTQDGDWHGFEARYEWPRKRIRYTTSLQEFSQFVDPQGTVAGKFLPEES